MCPVGQENPHNTQMPPEPPEFRFAPGERRPMPCRCIVSKLPSRTCGEKKKANKTCSNTGNIVRRPNTAKSGAKNEKKSSSASAFASSPQRPRQPPIPPPPHAQNTLLPIIMPVLPRRIAQNHRKEPEAGRGPGADGDAERDEGREEEHDYQHRGAVRGAVGARVDEVQLQVERRREEGGELGGERGPRGEEAEGLEEEGGEEGEERPEGDGEGEEGAGTGEEELGRVLAGFAGTDPMEMGFGEWADVRGAAGACLRALSRGTRPSRRRRP